MELMSSGVDLQKLLKRVPGEPHSEHVGLLVGVGALALGDSSSCQPRWSRERRTSSFSQSELWRCPPQVAQNDELDKSSLDSLLVVGSIHKKYKHVNFYNLDD